MATSFSVSATISSSCLLHLLHNMFVWSWLVVFSRHELVKIIYGVHNGQHHHHRISLKALTNNNFRTKQVKR